MTQNSVLGYVPSNYNYIINPSFEVNQRGVASVDASNAYPVDRWYVGNDTDTYIASQEAASIPVCEGNMDYQLYLEDLAERGEPYPEEVIE